jgi:hypothetical protein
MVLPGAIVARTALLLVFTNCKLVTEKDCRSRPELPRSAVASWANDTLSDKTKTTDHVARSGFACREHDVSE